MLKSLQFSNSPNIQIRKSPNLHSNLQNTKFLTPNPQILQIFKILMSSKCSNPQNSKSSEPSCYQVFKSSFSIHQIFKTLKFSKLLILKSSIPHNNQILKIPKPKSLKSSQLSNHQIFKSLKFVDHQILKTTNP